jgi:protein-L-isoaspartate O-methyltransferase
LFQLQLKRFQKKLINQLKDKGTMVIPVGNNILKIQKGGKTEKYEGFVFVL